MVDIAIQVVNFNTKPFLISCLETLLVDLAGAGFTWQLHVLDNGSSDDLSDLDRLFPPLFLRGSLERSPRNLGFGGGHNLLAGRATSKLILILNPDVTFFQERTVSRLYETLVAWKTAKVIGPKLVGPTGRVDPWDHGRLRRAGGDLGGRRRVSWVSGAVCLVEREAFERVGGFDERFFLYREDEDLCLRIRQIGGDVVYDPSVCVGHHRGVAAKRRDHLQRSDAAFAEKHAGGTPRGGLETMLERSQPLLYLLRQAAAARNYVWLWNTVRGNPAFWRATYREDLTVALAALERDPAVNVRELAPVLGLVRRRRPATVVEVGTTRGGTLYAWLRAVDPAAKALAVLPPQGPFTGNSAPGHISRLGTFGVAGQDVQVLAPDPALGATRDRVAQVLGGRRIELLALTGQGCDDLEKQFGEYAPLLAPTGVVVLFGIRSASGQGSGMRGLWEGVSRRHPRARFLDRGSSTETQGDGIGVVWLGAD